MRFKSKPVDDYCIYAVTGTNTVSFAIDFSKATTKGLLGFAVQRTYPGNEVHFLPGKKIFQSEYDAKKTDPTKPVSTETDPVQSFVWDDFTLDPDTDYTFTFYPMKGKPGALIKGNGIPITVKTEPAFSNLPHDIFFNRGVASSQAYAQEFNNTSPDKLVGKKQQEAFNWLGRDLCPAIMKFITEAKKGETILGCFYEFNYLPVLKAFKQAIDNGVNVHLIIDAKMNGKAAKGKGKPKTNDPRDKSLEKIKEAGIPLKNVILRQANKNMLQHNKYMVYLQGAAQKPVAVWTGSTNITESGIFGQTNVGHWVRDAKTAATYKKYWDLLSSDPGEKDDQSPAEKKAALKEYKNAVMAIQSDIDGDIPQGITPVFSPRSGLAMLEKYFSLVDKAEQTAGITLAFGITADLKSLLEKHTPKSPVVFMMLEKKDAQNPRSKAPFEALSNVKNNVYEAYGAYLENPVYEFVLESNMKNMHVTTFVNYIHSKFLIKDALSDDPIVVTGSANFSPPSTVGNDENMMIIRGNQRVADIYFTEFNRLFNHYYFRAVVDELKNSKVKKDDKVYFLSPNDSWIKAYKTGSLRQKRVDMFVKMSGTKTL